jgi:hypothetical protein
MIPRIDIMSEVKFNFSTQDKKDLKKKTNHHFCTTKETIQVMSDMPTHVNEIKNLKVPFTWKQAKYFDWVAYWLQMW